MNEKIALGLTGSKETIVCEHNVASHVPRFKHAVR